MLRSRATLFFTCFLLAVSLAGARELSFADRVEAQRALDRVYYSHRIDASRPFDGAVPQSVQERKVRTYLAQSLALEEQWNTPVTASRLKLELERIVEVTRFPERLVELYIALDGDPLLIYECLARPALVQRLSASFFANDTELHADSRARIQTARDAWIAGDEATLLSTAGRTVVRWVPDHSESARRITDSQAATERLKAAEFARRRAALVAGPLDVTPVTEYRDAFEFRVILRNDENEVRFARYEVEKRSLGDWLADRGGPSEGLLSPPPGLAPTVEWPASNRSSEAGCEGAWDNASFDDAPDAMGGHTTIWTGSRMIVWGGDANSVRHAQIYDPTIDTWVRSTEHGAPEARQGHTAVWTGTEMVIWGGVRSWTTPVLNTGARYDPSTDLWSALSSTGAPDARRLHTAVWTGDTMIVWGGVDGDGVRLDTGARYDPQTDSWSTISTSAAPQARERHTAVWTGDEMIVWGGLGDPYVALADGGRYDPALDTWSATAVLGAPEGRRFHSAVWSGTEMIVWGGWGPSSQSLQTGGRYDPGSGSWTATTVAGAPPGRRKHTAVWSGDEMLVWGGGGSGIGLRGGRYDPLLDVWTLIVLLGAPEAREAHSAVWTGDRMVVWGGDFAGPVNDGGRYDPLTDSWTPTELGSGPEPRSNHTATWTGSLMVVWGGSSVRAGKKLNSGARYDPTLDLWTPTSETGAPLARADHTAVWSGEEVIVWGGQSAEEITRGGRYEPLADLWLNMSNIEAPSGRTGHTAVWADGEMIVWGGVPLGEEFPSDTGARYSPQDDVWSSMYLSESPRTRHTAVWTGDVMVVFGGDNNGVDIPAFEAFADGMVYEPQGVWTPLPTTGQPLPRSRHTAVWTGDKMIVWGGHRFDNFTSLNSGGVFDTATVSWSQTSTTDAPSERRDHLAVWTGAEMIVWGGHFPGTNDGARYVPGLDRWIEMPMAGAPTPRSTGATETWTGEMMLVWDGRTDATGGRYVTSATDSDGGGWVDPCDNCPAIVNPAQEDDDLDGAGNACDCAPLDPQRVGPGEVFVLHVQRTDMETARLAWGAAEDADSYAVTRGSTLTQTAGQYGGCLQNGIATTGFDDSDLPAPGESFLYLVQGESPVCGIGSLGAGSDGVVRVNLDADACN